MKRLSIPLFRINLKYSLLFIIFLGLWVYSLTEPTYSPTLLKSQNNYNFPAVIAHKALSSDEFPGNSLSAVIQTLDTSVEGIEVDVRMSKDSVLFLYHGDILEDYTNLKGVTENFNWSFLKGAMYNGTMEKLLLLDDFLSLVNNQKVIFLDIKSNDIFNIEMARKVVNIINKHKLEKTVFVESFNPITLGSIRKYGKNILLMYDFTDNIKASVEESQDQFNRIPWFLKQYWFQKQIRRIIEPDVLGPRFNFNREVLQSLVRNNYPIICWTVDDFSTAKSLYDAGVMGLQSNKPKIIIAAKSNTN